MPSAADRDALPDLVATYMGRTGMREIVEVGSFAGVTALMMTSDNPTAKLFCIDTWRGSPNDITGDICATIGQKNMFQTFCRNVGGKLFDQIIPLVGSSLTYAEIWRNPVALVFIDANHDYDPVMADIEAWWPHVAHLGCLCGHDYNGFPGVYAAVNDFAGKRKLPVHSHREVWWVVKE